jgi:predicted porin
LKFRNLVYRNISNNYKNINYSIGYEKTITKDIEAKDTTLYNIGLSYQYSKNTQWALYCEYETAKYIDEQFYENISYSIKYLISDNLALSIQYNYYISKNLKDYLAITLSYYF